MCERDQTEEPGGLGWSPLSRGAVWQGDHHGLQVLAHDLELADGLELHGLPSQVFLGRHGVGEDVQQQGGGTRSVDTEGDCVTHHGLKQERGVSLSQGWKWR